MSAVPTTPAQTAAEAVAFPRTLARAVALPLIFVLATGYHFLQSRGHATPTVFNDELLYAKLSQSIAAGHGLAIRGEHFFFPAPLAPLVQAPAWLLGSMPDAFAAAKLLNAAVMSAAVFPAYWIARQLVRPSFAYLTAAAAVTVPAFVYHAYLMSEALAYPVFLLAVAVLARAVVKPSWGMTIAVPLTCALAVGTRVQFLVLPVAYLVTVALCGRGDYRRHLLPTALTAAFVALLVGVPGALGQYGQATHLSHAPDAIAHWALTNTYLLPYSLGLTIVPGALFGLGFMLVRPQRPFERAVAVLTVAATLLFIGQASLIGAGEAHRPLERYLFYVTPLLFLAFFSYVERGAPKRRAYLAATCFGALALSQVSLPGLTGTAAYFFDSVTLTGFARTSYLIGLTNASLVYSVAPVAFAVFLVALPLRSRGVGTLFALVAMTLSVATGAAAYTTDRLVTAWSARSFGGSPTDWLDRSNLGPSRYLALPHANTFLGTYLESWNRDLRGVVVLDTPPPDPFPVSVAHVRPDGLLEIGGSPAAAQTLVVNVSGSAIGLDGRVVARPRDGLVAYRIPADAHVRWLASGLSPDGWTGTRLRYRSWPMRAGRYELTLWVPSGTPPRKIEVGTHPYVVRAGAPRRIIVPTAGEPLELLVDVQSSPLGGRVLGVKVRGLRFLGRSG
jgi:hypothetical protein